MTRALRPHEHCLNCGVAVATRFCPECGQENTDYRVSLGHLLGDLADEVFQLESRLWRTLWTLFRRPGLLTLDYNVGRRVRYTTPVRLYLLASVVYFFVVGLHPTRPQLVHVEAGEASELQQQIARTPPGIRRDLLLRVATIAKDPAGFAARAEDAARTWVPRLMALLVPLFGLLCAGFFRRQKRFYVEHLTFALHGHSVAFLLFTVGELARDYFGGGLAFIAVTVWTFLAARRVYGDSWPRLAWKLPLVGLVYAVFVGVGIGAVFFLGGFAS